MTKWGGFEYLVCQISLLHPKVCTDVLINRPSELIVEFPCHKGHRYGPNCNNAWYGYQERSDGRLDRWVY